MTLCVADGAGGFSDAESQRVYQSLDAFKVDEKIGERGFLVVDKGAIKATSQPVEMKRINQKKASHVESAYHLLVKEFKAMCSVSHPALQYAVGLYRPDDWKETVLVTPWYENGSLKNVMEESPDKLNDTMKTRIAFGVCSAMIALHGRGVVHGDLKPENVMIDDKFCPIVSGFGLDHGLEDEAHMSVDIGSYYYRAPEVLHGAQSDAKSDVYSFGLLMYELWTGQVPYSECKSPNELFNLKGTYALALPRGGRVPKLFSDIIGQCNQPPERRPTFEELYNTLLVRYQDIRRASVAEIDTYKQFLKLNGFHEDKFRIPHQLVEVPQPEKKVEGEETALEVCNNCPILLEELNSVLEREGDRHVVIVMVLGSFETGKSTYLRTLTGNAAFYPGKGTFSQTQGALLDGPYRVSELIERIPDDDYYGELREQCSAINIPSDPSIYFLDCQGIGDEKYEQYQKHILEHVNSVFACVSTICINICKFNDRLDIMKSNITAVRRAQLIRQPSCSSLTQLLFLVRDYREEHGSCMADYDPNTYEEMLGDFTAEWMKEHAIASNHYFQECIHLRPLGDIKLNLQSYLTTVWESLRAILKMIAATSPISGRDVWTSVDNLRSVFNEQFQTFCLKLQNFSFPDPSVSSSLKQCLACCHVLCRIVVVRIQESIQNQSDTQELLQVIQYGSLFITRFVLPYVIGSDMDLTGKDFLQYQYEIDKEVMLHLRSNADFWEKIAKQWQTVQKAARPMTGVVLTAQAALNCAPGIGNGLALLLGLGTSIGCWAFWKVQKNRLDQIWDDGVYITSFYPQIWKRDIRKQKPSVYDIAKLSRPFRSKGQLIVFYEQPSRMSRLLVQSLVGLELPEVLEAGKCYYFSSLKVSDLLKRHSREAKDPKVWASMAPTIDFLYIGSMSDRELHHLARVFPGEATLWVTSHVVEGEEQLQLVYPNHQPNLYVFVMSDKFYSSLSEPISLQPFLAELNRVTSEYRRSTATGDSSYFLPIYASSDALESCGPRTNVSIRYSCRFLLGDAKIRENPNEE